MAPTPALSGAQRNALRVQIAAKRAEQVKAERAAQAAKDKEFVAKAPKTKSPVYSKGRVVSRGPDAPAKVKAGGRTVHTRTRVPTTVVQGSHTRAPKSPPPPKPSIADEAKAKAMARRVAEQRAAKRPSRAVTPQSEKPNNPNYKVKGVSIAKDDEKKKAPVKTPKTPAKGKAKISKGSVPGLVPRKLPDSKIGTGPVKSSPGMGAPTGGTGRDADGGKQRGQFEDDRREGMAGQGRDRPPVYKPQDDGERGGYTNRTSKGPVRPIPPYQKPDDKPRGKIPPMRKPGGLKVNTGSTAVRGLMPR